MSAGTFYPHHRLIAVARLSPQDGAAPLNPAQNEIAVTREVETKKACG